ncbi:acyl-CoA dehydrogenase [Alcanivorax hongdengensis A-11-3]|uniref:Acyl-coenzyme A dehydrogenase n=1 Tax=Alcanivorax hongdengensis A-11-3 TaxID=1177179 RepID=L0WE15_9GAMM|nr:acyl-CoA dehydrogenase [Alcanivorax hongdengensis]EKF75078.1 acyl-CoA dehydrogenase [Alcanivorax hongdengensis A-11-3]
MLSLLAIVLLVATLLTIFYQGLSRGVGSAVFAIVWLLCGFLASWLFNPILLILVAGVLVVLNHVDLRQKFISRPVYNALAKVMPAIGDTEREAIEAGTTWFEADLFSGKPDWQNFSKLQFSTLTDEEQSFLDNEVVELCQMLDEWQIFHELRDLPEEVWDFLKHKGFFSLIIPREYGGKAFSPYAQSRIMSKIATRSLTAAVTAMVPNSLGPGELLAEYGTQEQKDRWLPGLAKGDEIPCFGLTGPEAGSDAGAIPDTGVICKGKIDGKEVLGMRLNFAKRWITLAPVATVVGLAFKLYDPDHLLGDEDELGITCALIPASTKGVEIGRRHYPGSPFMNGPINGKDVFVPLDAIIGGPEMAGKGWRMLIECLGAGRGISLPALATASGEIGYRMTGAFGRIRRQFKTAVGEFEGVQEASAEIAGIAYTLEAYRHLVTRSLEDGAPSVVTAMAKYHATEMMRDLINHGMDIAGGRGIQLGPRNFLALPYQSTPIAITVEGANILTRSLMIFGQGAMRCHPYLYEELQAIQADDKEKGLQDFDKLFFSHAGHTAGNMSRAIVQGLAGGLFSQAPGNADAFSAPWYRLINRYSAVLASTADVALGLLGGDLKRRELLSARLGDMHSQLLIACAILKYHATLPRDEANDAHATYALRRAFSKAHDSLDAFTRNFGFFGIAHVFKALFFPFGRPCMAQAPDDDMIRMLGTQIMEPSSVRDALAEPAYISRDPEDAIGRVEVTYSKLLEVEPAYMAFLKADGKGQLQGSTVLEKLQDAAEKGVIARDQVDAVNDYDAMRYDCLLTDAFDKNLKKVKVHAERPSM